MAPAVPRAALQPLEQHLAAMVGPLEALEEQVAAASEAAIATYEARPEGGVSYLDVKQQLLGHYNLGLLLYCRMKLAPHQDDNAEKTEESLEGEPLIRRLFMLRSVLEKLRPLDKKLRFQLDRLLRLSDNATSAPKTETQARGTGQAGDEGLSIAQLTGPADLHFRPRPDMLTAHGEPRGGSAAEATGKLYQPPKLVATTYSELDSAEVKAQKAMEKARRRLNQSEMMASLRDEFGEEPEMVDANMFSSGNVGGVQSSKALQLRREEVERQRWEESRFTRASVSKAEKLQRKHVQKAVTGADSLADFTANADVLSTHFAQADKRTRAAARRAPAAKKSDGRRSGAPRGALGEAIGALAKNGAAYDQQASNKKRRRRL